jgi:hypothetical protein
MIEGNEHYAVSGKVPGDALHAEVVSALNGALQDMLVHAKRQGLDLGDMKYVSLSLAPVVDRHLWERSVGWYFQVPSDD